MIFEEQISRKPDHYPWAKTYKKAMNDGHWTVDEFNFQSDIQDFKVNLTDQERETVTRVLSAIAQIEVAVKLFWAKLGDNLPHAAFHDLGITMANVEVIHNDAYEKLLEILGLEHVIEENLKLDIIQGRVKYLRKYLHKYYKDSKKQYVYSIVLFTMFVEGVSLFSQFYTILWLYKSKRMLKDTSQQVRYTSKEETLHMLAGSQIINTIKSEHPELFDEELTERVLSEAKSAYEAESNIIDWFLGEYSDAGEDGALNATVLKEFVKYRINFCLSQIGFPEVFELDQSLIEQTYWFDAMVQGKAKTDFFVRRPVDYSMSFDVFNEDSLF